MAAKIRESFGERDTPSRLHDLGRSQLLAGRYDDAAESLLAASREQPANARYLNDVAAVQLERARLGLRPDDLPRALASADRARRLDPSLNEAWFNRALAATALSLHDQARSAWVEYLARDSSSAWSAEARARLDQLSKPTAAAAWVSLERRLDGSIDAALADEAVRTQTTEARKLLDNTLLPDWTAAVQGGRSAAGELARIRSMADAFARVAGDSLYRDVVAAIDRAEARGPAAVTALAAAHATYATAAALYAEDRFAEAAPGLSASRSLLAGSGSPFADRPALDLATILYVGGKADDALATLSSTLASAQASGYAFHEARATWIQGLIAFGQGRLAEAQSRYEQTLASFERMGDAEQVATAHTLLAALHFYLGDRATEWHHRLRSLEGLGVSRSPRLRHAVLSTAAAALRFDNPDIALLIQDAVLENATNWGRKAAIAETLSQRGAVFLALGRLSEASTDLANARKTLLEVPDAQFRSRLEVALLASESDQLRGSDPEAAVAAATRAIALVSQRRDQLRLAQLNLKLATANLAWGRIPDAEAAIDRGLRAFEAERASLADEGRLSTLDESWRLFDVAVQLALKKKDYPRAFALTENARARTLVEARRNARPRTLTDVQRVVQPDEALVALSQFDDELAIWVIRHDGTTVVHRPVTRLDAVRLVARQRDEIRHEARNPDASADLFNQILRPIASQLKGVSRLIVVPDAPYEDAAFAAFWDRSRQRFLVEDVSVSMSPSASLFVSAAGLRQSAGNNDPLILGGPGSKAEAEARAVAGVYPARTLLTGADATRTRFLEQAAGRRVLHVAAGTATNATHPMLSRVLLADEPGRRYSGALMGLEIAQQAMPTTSVVVIDEVEPGENNRGEGTLALTRAFMAAGIPAVVGTLPGADEAAARELMVGFHRQMSTGISAERALATLQRNVLHSNGRRLGAWSALVLYGSDR
ncbi:MAG: CHAT domain-containing protein [Vicinamibacterales bacterium]|jgi:CHAT domain-containing protein/predicted negative regulator of RcsB-dependent stress response